jgi:hypothetical protein
MEEILSSDNFTANGDLWARKSSSDGRAFRRDQKSNDGAGFAARPLSYSAVEEKSIEHPVAEEIVLVGQDPSDQLAVEAAVVEPTEPMVSFTESEYQTQIRDKIAEAERALRNEFETKFKDQVEHLSSQQSVFFEKVMDALQDDHLTSEIGAIALKIGSLLARAQLRLDESVVVDFVDTALKRIELQDSKTVSVQMSKDWESFLEALNDCRPEGYEFIYEETLRPGDIIVTAGDSGYFDFFHERLEEIEDQLSSKKASQKNQGLIDLLQNAIHEMATAEADSVEIQATTNQVVSELSEEFSPKDDGAGSDNESVVDDEITDE